MPDCWPCLSQLSPAFSFSPTQMYRSPQRRLNAPPAAPSDGRVLRAGRSRGPRSRGRRRSCATRSAGARDIAAAFASRAAEAGPRRTPAGPSRLRTRSPIRQKTRTQPPRRTPTAPTEAARRRRTSTRGSAPRVSRPSRSARWRRSSRRGPSPSRWETRGGGSRCTSCATGGRTTTRWRTCSGLASGACTSQSSW